MVSNAGLGGGTEGIVEASVGTSVALVVGPVVVGATGIDVVAAAEDVGGVVELWASTPADGSATRITAQQLAPITDLAVRPRCG